MIAASSVKVCHSIRSLENYQSICSIYSESRNKSSIWPSMQAALRITISTCMIKKRSNSKINQKVKINPKSCPHSHQGKGKNHSLSQNHPKLIANRHVLEFRNLKKFLTLHLKIRHLFNKLVKILKVLRNIKMRPIDCPYIRVKPRTK